MTQTADASAPIPLSKKTHSPYTTPVLAPQDVSVTNRPYFAVSCEDDSDSSWDGNYMPPSASTTQPQSLQSFHEAEGPTYAASPISGPTTPLATQGSPSLRSSSGRRISYFTPIVAPEGAVHLQLAGQVDFIQPPYIAPIDHPTPNFPCYRLFLGQIRFETTAAEIRWLIRHIIGVTALKIEHRGTGCFLAHFRTFEDLLQVKTLHKRVLFDRTGVWYARTPGQIDLMHYYVESVLQYAGRSFRLPKDMMVVEEEKMSKAALNFYYHQQQQQQQQHVPSYQQFHQQQQALQARATAPTQTDAATNTATSEAECSM